MPAPAIPKQNEKTIFVLGPQQKTKSKICNIITTNAKSNYKNTISSGGQLYWRGNQDIPIKIVEAENDFDGMTRQLPSLKEIHVFLIVIDAEEPDYDHFHQTLRLLKAYYGEKFLSNTVIDFSFDQTQKKPNVEVRSEFYKKFQDFSKKIKDVPIVFLKTDVERNIDEGLLKKIFKKIKPDEEAKQFENEMKKLESSLQKKTPLTNEGINDLKLLLKLMQEEFAEATTGIFLIYFRV